jgi:hypothetical protein
MVEIAVGLLLMEWDLSSSSCGGIVINGVGSFLLLHIYNIT